MIWFLYTSVVPMSRVLDLVESLVNRFVYHTMHIHGVNYVTYIDRFSGSNGDGSLTKSIFISVSFKL
jgi:hypothetical protein